MFNNSKMPLERNKPKGKINNVSVLYKFLFAKIEM